MDRVKQVCRCGDFVLEGSIPTALLMNSTLDPRLQIGFKLGNSCSGHIGFVLWQQIGWILDENRMCVTGQQD